MQLCFKLEHKCGPNLKCGYLKPGTSLNKKRSIERDIWEMSSEACSCSKVWQIKTAKKYEKKTVSEIREKHPERRGFKRKTYKNLNRYLCTSLHTIVFHNSQKIETTQMPINWWMDNKIWYIYRMEYYSFLKSKETLIHATMWMKLEDFTLSK